MLPDGRRAQAIEVPIARSDERWSEFTLEDGTVIRGKLNLISILRVVDEYDPAGFPVYQFNAAPALGFAEVPEHLKAGGKKSS